MKTRLAICFYGQPRFIDNAVVYGKYKEIIAKYDTDVYIHSWVSGTENFSMSASDWSLRYGFVEKSNTISQLISMYSPKKFLFEPPQEFSLRAETREIVKSLRYYSPNNESNLISHLTSLGKSISLVDDPLQYDLFLITRLDAYMNVFPDLVSLDPNFTYYASGMANEGRYWIDGSFVVGSKYVRALNVMDKIDEISTTVPMFTSEEYTKHGYLKCFGAETSRCLESFKVYYVRSNDGLKVVV